MLSGGTIQNGTLVSNIAFSLQAGTVSAILADTGFVTKTTEGAVTLSGANTYSGGTYVDAGTLALTGVGTPGAANGSTTVPLARLTWEARRKPRTAA
jgi:autotransporter-associated beta strand protein